MVPTHRTDGFRHSGRAVSPHRNIHSECVFPDSALNQADRLDTFTAGRKIHELLLAIHKTDELYRSESSESLPHGFLTMRDSMIAIDKASAESLTVEKVNIGGLKK